MTGPRHGGTQVGDGEPASTDLRAAFRHGATYGTDPLGVDTATFLDRVHRGAHRRRVHRSVGGVCAAAAAAAVVAFGVSVVPAQPADRAPSAAAGGTAAGPLAVYEVDESSGGVWGLASSDCGRARLCPKVVHSSDGVDWDVRYPRADGRRVLGGELREVSASDDGTTVVVGGSGLAVSTDAGSTWSAARGVHRQVTGLAVGDTEAVATLLGAGPRSVATGPVGDDRWTTADVPVDDSEQVVQPFAAGDVVGAAVLRDQGRAPETVAVLTRRSGADWQRTAAPCRSRTPEATSDGHTVWFLCADGAGSVLATARVPDGGSTAWTRAHLPGATAVGLGPDGTGGARVSLDDRLFTVDAHGGAVEVIDSPALELATDDYAWRSISGDWMASFRGEVVRRSGQSWSEVPVP